jgi:hypothetical protein
LQLASICLPPLQVPVQEQAQVSGSGVPPPVQVLPHWHDFELLFQTFGEVQVMQALPFQLLPVPQHAEGSISQMLPSEGVPPPLSPGLGLVTKSQPTAPCCTRPVKTEQPAPVQPVSCVI